MVTYGFFNGNDSYPQVLDELFLCIAKIINVQRPDIFGYEFDKPIVKLLYFFNEIFQFTL